MTSSWKQPGKGSFGKILKTVFGSRGLKNTHDLHRAELCRHAGADASREREPGEDRTELQHHRLADERPDEVQRDGAGERVRRLKREDDAGEGGDEKRDWERVDADAAHLDDQEPAPDPDVAEPAQHVHQEVTEPSDGLDGDDRAAADGLNHGNKKWPGFLRATSTPGRRVLRCEAGQRLADVAVTQPLERAVAQLANT